MKLVAKKRHLSTQRY